MEKIADIVAEIRAYGAQPPPRFMWLEIADRIEAAAKREIPQFTIPEDEDNETVEDIVADMSFRRNGHAWSLFDEWIVRLNAALERQKKVGGGEVANAK